jgi:nucleotide-binding universal stress UspA family protein
MACQLGGSVLTAALCFDGVDDEALVDAASELLRGFVRLESWCGYGDAAERFIEDVAERHHAPHPHHPHDQRTIDAEQAEAIADHGVALLQRAAFSGAARTFAGRDPGHAIAEASDTETVLILGAGHRSGIGPKSVGHVARFIVDHARGPVLILRLR